jgi:hypothetical protein
MLIPQLRVPWLQIPLLRIPSVPVASPESIGSRQPVAMPFYVADKLCVACVWSVPCAAVPLTLYGLKIDETQSALHLPALFLANDTRPARLLNRF